MTVVRFESPNEKARCAAELPNHLSIICFAKTEPGVIYASAFAATAGFSTGAADQWVNANANGR